MLELVRAYSWRYRVGKRWHLARVAGTLGLAAAAPVVVFAAPRAADAVAATAGAWVLVGRTVFSAAERRQVIQAVTIQEEFDTELFGLPWNTSLAGPRAAGEDIADATRHITDDAKLRDWYADTRHAPSPLDVLLCQRSSAVWGRRAHREYALLVAAVAIAWLIAGIIMGVTANTTLAGYLIKVFLPSQPAFLDSVDLVRAHWTQARDKQGMEHDIQALWNQMLADPTAASSTPCRAIQDRSYRLRRDGPQVAQWFYKVRRGRDQQAMVAAVNRLLDALS